MGGIPVLGMAAAEYPEVANALGRVVEPLLALTAKRVTSFAVEVLGRGRVREDSRAEKLYRDAKIGAIYEGTSFMQLAAIAKAIL